MLCLWNVEAGQELRAIVNLLDYVSLDMQPIHHVPELVDVGEARQVQVVGLRHSQVVGLGTVPWEDGTREAD